MLRIQWQNAGGGLEAEAWLEDDVEGDNLPSNLSSDDLQEMTRRQQ